MTTLTERQRQIADQALAAARTELANHWPGAEDGLPDEADTLVQQIVDAVVALRAEHGLRVIKQLDNTWGALALRKRISPDGVGDPTALIGFLGLSQVGKAAADVYVNAYRRGPRKDRRVP